MLYLRLARQSEFPAPFGALLLFFLLFVVCSASVSLQGLANGAFAQSATGDDRSGLIQRMLTGDVEDFSACEGPVSGLNAYRPGLSDIDGHKAELSKDGSFAVLNLGGAAVSSEKIALFLKRPGQFLQKYTAQEPGKKSDEPKIDRVSIENAFLQGALDIGHYDIPHAVRFHNVVFCGSPEIPKPAILFRGGKLGKSLTIRESIALRKIHVGSSDFGRDVSLFKVWLLPNYWDAEKPYLETLPLFEDPNLLPPLFRSGNENDCTALQLEYSKVEGTLNLARSFFGGGVCIRRNEVKTVRSGISHFTGYFDLTANKIGNGLIEAGLFDGSSIDVSYNMVEGNMEFEARRATMDCLLLAKNRVDANLAFEFHQLVEPQFQICAYENDISNRESPELDISDNRVGGFTELEFANDLEMLVRANNLISDHGLVLELSRIQEEHLENRKIEDAHLIRLLDRREDIEEMRNLERLASDALLVSNPLHVDLSGAQVGTLGWTLPLHESIKWHGTGFTYRHWGLGEMGISENEFIERLMLWRLALDSAAHSGSEFYYQPSIFDRLAFWESETDRNDHEASSLRIISDHLRDRGQTFYANKVAEEYKRQFYTNIPDDVGLLEESIRRAAVVFLWPGGYGARPERVIFFIIGGWLLGAFFYWSYVKFKRKGMEIYTAAQRRKIGGSTYDPMTDPYFLRHYGSVSQPGFAHFDASSGGGYADFTLLRYSLDTIVPVISLFGYDKFYPIAGPVRFVSAFQHILGWWFLTVFTASLTIL